MIKHISEVYIAVTNQLKIVFYNRLLLTCVVFI